MHFVTYETVSLLQQRTFVVFLNVFQIIMLHRFVSLAMLRCVA